MANIPPVANPGVDREVQVGQTVILDGSASTDSDGSIVEYDWEQTSGNTVALTGSGPTRSFVPSLPGTYTFDLTVTDNGVEVVDPDPDPPPPASWQAMVDSRSFDQVDAWYDAYTGFDGLNPNDPEDTPLALEDLEVVSGVVSSTGHGQVIEGLLCSGIRIQHNNVTVRRCLIRGGGVYGWYTNPTFTSAWTGTQTEFCTFEGAADGGLLDKACIVVQIQTSMAHTFRNCEVRGWSSGWLAQGGANVEYCWTHDFYFEDGPHVSSFNARGSNVRFFRNYATEGGSPCVSIYCDYFPMTNISISENIINGTGNNLPSYLWAVYGGEYAASATNLVVGGNYLGNVFRYGRTAGFSATPWGVNGNVRNPDIDFLTGNII